MTSKSVKSKLKLQPTNAVYTAAENTCMDVVESSPEMQDLIRQRDELIAAIEGKVDPKVARDLSDLFFNFANPFGRKLFRLGFSIARDPSILFDLPDSNMLGA